MRAPGDSTPISAQFERRAQDRRAPSRDEAVAVEQRLGERRRGLTRLIDPPATL
jgi:hypothetical protein